MSTARSFAAAFAALALVATAAAPVSALTLHRNADFAAAHTVALKAGDTVTVAKTANLRSGPSAKAKKIAGLSKGTKLQVTEVKDGWVKVKGPAGDGYVSSKLVK